MRGYFTAAAALAVRIAFTCYFAAAAFAIRRIARAIALDRRATGAFHFGATLTDRLARGLRDPLSASPTDGPAVASRSTGLPGPLVARPTVDRIGPSTCAVGRALSTSYFFVSTRRITGNPLAHRPGTDRLSTSTCAVGRVLASSYFPASTRHATGNQLAHRPGTDRASTTTRTASRARTTSYFLASTRHATDNPLTRRPGTDRISTTARADRRARASYPLVNAARTARRALTADNALTGTIRHRLGLTVLGRRRLSAHRPLRSAWHPHFPPLPGALGGAPGLACSV
ncbi:hypothetical protein ATK30_5068 [Amycolatopsis echigonensis]|uniref:Uncharacterized protein n=1 Tax=Amycolatopsis echigonensis TaxID=2576905 RepID=A0A2N3WK15_9PSEU|nr:hypothetical protein [Amycolatopsis niigatensis]PKV94195.1 hypothetical protein ATK30_5068 [Amycolatopsis niigatensis]